MSFAFSIPSKRIEIIDRSTGQVVVENVFGDSAMKLAYGTKGGLRFVSTFLVNRSVSKLYGAYNNLPASRGKINSFVNNFNINMDESSLGVDDFVSFNDFFARKLKPTARPIAVEERALASPADGRLLVFPRLSGSTLSFVKWAPIHLEQLFAHDTQLTRRYKNGQCAILRLCPSDYHRFHFPVAGIPSESRVIDGCLHSVSPYALEKKLAVHCMNLRTICEIETDGFGTVLLLEIGALFVGSIVQTYSPAVPVRKGDEKGYFKFGGSTTILFLEEDTAVFDRDLVDHSQRGYETLVKMGERIGLRK